MQNQPSRSPVVSVISSFSTDRILSTSGAVVGEYQGGPALFIGDALEHDEVPFMLHANEPFLVEITPLEDGGETGRVLSGPALEPVEPGMLSEWTILSTIGSEWSVDPRLVLPGHLFIDVQGFTRDPSQLGGKQLWEGITGFVEQVFCLKGTKEELLHLPREALESQKGRLLLQTNGADGVEVYNRGVLSRHKIDRNVERKSTVGAGDTFFAYFVSALFKGADVNESVGYAIGKTTDFLERKQ